jgi:hypothetical protein
MTSSKINTVRHTNCAPISIANQHGKCPLAIIGFEGRRLTRSSSQPPKRRPPTAAHNITAQEEADIKEAFGLFSEPADGEKEGVIPIGDVRRAMT